MSILSGFIKCERYRFLDNGNYQKQSEWTSDQSVEMSDGSTLKDTINSLKNALNNKSETQHKHSATDINSGVFSFNRLPIVPIHKGGTGASTAETALKNLGVNSTSTELNQLQGIASNVQEQIYSVQSQLQGKQNTLGYTPVQQGGGVNQGNNKIYIGWKTNQKLGVTVDGVDMGDIITSKNFTFDPNTATLTINV